MGIRPAFSRGRKILLEVIRKMVGKDIELVKASKVVRIAGSPFKTFHPFEMSRERRRPEKVVYQVSDVVVGVSAFRSAQSGSG